MDKATSAVEAIGGEEKASQLKSWKANRDAAASAEAAMEKQKEERAKAAERGEEVPSEAEMGPGDAVVVSKSANSSWDRFGAGLSDMPLLSSVFDNPLFERMFGESEIAASIREMKEIDPQFNLADFQEEMEEVV